jgi:trimeric autotransporter adhesin
LILSGLFLFYVTKCFPYAKPSSNQTLCMKKLYTLVSVLFLFLISSNSTAQVSTNGASGMLTAYGSLAGALSDLNAIGTVTAKVVITLEANETAPVGGFVVTATGTATDSIVIDGATFTVTAPVQGAGSTNDAVIKLVGSDYVAIRNFVIQEQTTTVVLTPVGSNTMTEFGVALYGASTANGAQNNTIQNNTITLNNSYLTSFGILSTCTFVSTVTTLGATPGAQTAAAGAENSNNKYYGNNISNVAFGIMIVAPAATATVKETGDDIGGTSASTGNTISYGNTSGIVAVAYPGAQNVAATMGGITITNAVGASVRFNTVTTTPIFTIATTGIILGFTPATPANSTFTNVVSDNNITINSSATAATAYGIEFGYGNGTNSTATLTAANNTVIINQTTTAATTTVLSAIRMPYSALSTSATGNIITINQTNTFNGILSGAVNGIIASALSVVIPTLTITGNNITFNQSLQNTTAISLTSTITGILAGSNLNNITTANINFNNITIKQAVTSTGTFGAGTANYISFVGTLAQPAAFTTLNVNSNNLNTLGSTIRYTGTVAGISHDFTNPATLSISNNIINFDRTGVGVTYGTFASAYTASAITTTTISGNNINFGGSITGNPTNVVGHNDLSGNTTMVKNITLDTVIMNLPNVNAGNQIGIIFQTGATPALGITTGSIANCIVSITSGGGTISGVEVRGTGTGILTNINDNTFNLSSSNNAPVITGVNINGGTRSRIFNNNFNSLAAPNSATGAPNIRSVWLQQGGTNSSFYNEVFNNTVSNVFTFAGTGSAVIDGITIGATSAFTNVYKNKIYGLTASTSGASTLVTGIRQNTPSAAGGITNIYNNYIGFDNSANPNASNVDAVRGIAFVTASTTSTHNVSHNTIYLAAVPSATVTNYGTTGIFQQNSPTPANASLVLRNNIIVNNSTAKGTGKTVAFRRNAVIGAVLSSNYNTASNNNLFYSGTPSSANVIFFESGTSTSAITLSNYQALANLSPRDNASVSENPPFLSTLGSNSNFLHINPAVGTVVESSGGTGTGITDDYDADVRCPGGSCPGASSKPDIGADELAGTCPVPVAPTALILTGTGPYTGNFTGAVPSPTGGYLVVRSTSPLQPSPTNGVSYSPAGTAVPGAGTPVSVSISTTTMFVDNPGAGTFYYWVFSYNTGCGLSPNYSITTTSSVTTACVAPAQPTVLNLTSVSSSNITGTFTASAASGYYVIRTTTGVAPVPAPVNGTPYVSSGTGTLVSSGPSTSFSATGLSGSTTYYFYVYAYNDACVGSPTYNLVAPLSNNIATQPCLLPGTYTVGPGGNYTSVGAVMTALSCFTFPPTPVPTTGAFFFEFLPTYNSSVEAFPLVISPVYNPSAFAITFRPQTGATGISITSGNTAGTLLFQGVALGQAPTYFVFDGRPGGLGVSKELTIQNTNVGSSYAIQFENGANNNTIQYCKVRSLHNGTSGGGGTINFASSNSTAGNSTNTITNNDIYNATGGTPTNAIYSNGISTAANNSNTISNNNIYDHFNATYTTAGINLAAYSNSWTINGNSFYQTTGKTFTNTTATYNAILAAATTVGGLTITDNFIGGTATSAGGGFMSIGGNGILRAIQLTTSATATSVQNNTITNIAFSSSNSSSAQSLISLVAGVINVGTVTANTIGSQVSTNRITVSLSDNTAGVNFAGILATSTLATDIFAIRNNTIGGIGVSGTSTSAAIQGINFSGATGADTVRNNIIGSNLSNSFTNGLNTTLTGILGNSSNTTPTQIISGNTIVNLSATNTGVNSYVTGIAVSGLGKYAIGNTANAGNTIYNLSSAGTNTFNYNTTGIVNSATTAGQSIYGNTIRSITSTSASADVGVVGIYYNGAAGAGNTIESNTIHSLDLASTNINSVITGIQAQGGAASYYNNMIRLGITSTGASITTAYGIYGLTENSGTNLFYMNSVYVGGSGVGAGSDSYAFFGANTTTQDIRNNIFWNARSNASAAVPNHYAMVLATNSGVANINFNDIVATGANGKVLGYYGTQQLTLSSWCTAIGASIVQWYSSLPGYKDPVGATPDLHINRGVITVAETGATSALTTALDIDRNLRSDSTQHDLGADAFTSSVAPVLIDGSITALISPASGFGCFTNSEVITITFKNNSGSTLDFTITPVTFNVAVTGATVANFTTTISTGTLAAGASQSIAVTTPPSLNMVFVGTYFFNCTFSVGSAGVDKDITNDEFTTTRTVGALAAGTASASPGSFCGVASGTPTITLTGASGGTIQWYEATALGGPYTPVGTNSASYTPATPINVAHFYRATVSCIASGFSATSNTVQVTISTPVLSSISANQNSCGPASFTFTASVSGSATTVARWYDASTGALAYTGSPFVTPLLSSTTTYNARAVDTSSTPVTATFGVGTSTNGTTDYPSPYTNWFGGAKHQMLIRASELTAAGVTAGDITSVTFYVASVGSTFSGSLTGFTVYMGSTATNTLTSTFLPVDATPVYSNASQPIVVGSNTHTFSTPFSWDGLSNIIIQTSYSNGNFGGSSDNVQMFFSPTAFVSTNFFRQDLQTPATILAATTGSTFNFATASPTVNRPNMTIGYKPFCSSTPSSVTATVNPAPTTVSLLSTTGSVTNSAADTITICSDSAKLVVSGGTTTQKSSVTVSSGTINLTINDFSGGLPSNLTNGQSVTMPVGATIDSIRVKINLTHTFDGDLNIHLRSPNTQVVNLISRRGGSGEDMVNTQISSNTANASMASGAAPFANALFRADLATITTTVPATTTNTFSSLFVAGTGAPQTWTISVHDMAAVDVGILQDWSITIFYQEPIAVPYLWSTTTPNSVWTNSGLSSAYTNQNINTVFVKPSADTNYVITATLGGCSKKDTVHVKVFNLSTAASSLSVSPSSGCSGSSITLTQTGGTLGTGASWKWYSDAAFTTLVGTSVAANALLTISPAATSTYYLRSEGGSAPCGGTVASGASVTYTVNPVNQWLGVNTDWTDPLNWCPGVPTSASNVTIPTVLSGNYPTIPAAATGSCNNLTITGSGTVTIAATGILRIAGNTTSTNNAINATVGTVEFNGSAAQTIKADHFSTATIANITISKTSSSVLTIDNTGVMLKLTGTVGFGAVNNAVLATSDKLTLISDASGTARIGDVTNNSVNTGNNITGKVVVERYVPARRSWRLLTSPIKASTLPVPNIFNQWQESAQSTTLGMLADPNPGYGAHVSKGLPYVGTFDQNNTGNSSIFYLTPSGWGGSPTTTNGTVAGANTGVITDHPAYMLFVRGNRATNLAMGIGAPTSATVLRNTGNIYVTSNSASPEVINGSGAYIVGLNTYYAFPNPYPSAISFERILNEPLNTGMQNIFYVWDANLTGSNGVGGWVTVTRTGAFTYSTSPNTPSLATGEIQSGSAFMMNYPSGGATLRYKEPFKVSNSNFSLLRPVPGNQIRTTLIAANADGTTSVNDGALAIFSSAYADVVNKDDANKMPNFAENICIVKDGIDLAIEKRKSILENDTVFFKISKMRSKNYSLSFDLEGMTCGQGLSPILEDLHLNTKTSLNIEGNTSYDFNIVSNTVSADPNRFRIIFKKLINYTGINANVVDEDVMVNWNVSSEFGIDRYEIERSVNGLSFSPAGNKLSEGNTDRTKIYTWLDLSPLPGAYYYRIKCIGKNGVVAYSNVAKVTVIKSAPAMFVFPNPVTSNIIRLQMNKMSAGVYETVLLSEDGKVINRSRISHTGGTATETISPKAALPNGNYKIEVTGPDMKRTILKIMVQK